MKCHGKNFHSCEKSMNSGNVCVLYSSYTYYDCMCMPQLPNAFKFDIIANQLLTDALGKCVTIPNIRSFTVFLCGMHQRQTKNEPISKATEELRISVLV